MTTTIEPQSRNGDEPSELDNLLAEVNVEPDDGGVTVTLVTELGQADIRVPPLGRWRSKARNALFSRLDDLAWAATTLSVEDLQTWMDLDPTQDEVEVFFQGWGRSTGQSLGESRAARRASTRTRGR
jgi:hypothetical protein